MSEQIKINFDDPALNLPITETLETIKLPEGYELQIVSLSTQLTEHPRVPGIFLPDGYDDDIDIRLARWIDSRMHPYFNKILDKPYQSGFDLSKDFSGMTVYVNNAEGEPVLVRNVLLYSPNYLAKDPYLVKDGHNIKIVNAQKALNLNPESWAIIPGWSYIRETLRATEGGSLRNIKLLMEISKTIVQGLNDQLKKNNFSSVLISQQEGENGDYDENGLSINTVKLPVITSSDIGKVITPADYSQWYRFFGLGTPTSKSTAGFASRSFAVEVPNVAHTVDGFGPVFLGNPKDYLLHPKRNHES